MIRALIGLLGLLVAFSAQAEPTCVSQEEMQEIASHFRQFQQYAQDQYCLDGSEDSNLLESLLFMRKTQFEAPMEVSSDELFSGRFQNDWYGYFINRISDIEIDYGCPKGVGAYVYGFFGSKMYVCTMLLTSDFTALDRASVFMHEARHIDGFPHVTCRQGARAGIRGACDDRISDGGSYAVSVETYAQISRYAVDIHPALKAYARAAATTYADEAFVTPVQIDRSEGLIVLASDQNFYRIRKTGANQVETQALGRSPYLGFIAPRAQHLILFPYDKNQGASYVFPKGEGEISQQAGEVARKYNELSPIERNEVLDAHVAAQWTALLYGRKVDLTCDYRSDAITTLSLPQGKDPLGFVYPNGYNRSHPQIFLSFSDGSLFEVGCSSSSRAFIRDSGQRYDVPMRRVHKAGSFVLGMDASGSLYEIKNSQPQALFAKEIDFAFEVAPYGHFDFLDLF